MPLGRRPSGPRPRGADIPLGPEREAARHPARTARRAPSAVARLFKMGIEPFLIAYAINIVVAQRLVRTLCSNCKRAMRMNDKDKLIFSKFGFTDEMIKAGTFYEPVGCEKCNDGYKGRAAIHEALYFTREIKQIIVSAGDEVDEAAIREQAIKDGMWTLRRSGMERMMEGVTTLEEIIATTFRQTVLTRFELRLHTERKNGLLSNDRIAEICR